MSEAANHLRVTCHQVLKSFKQLTNLARFIEFRDNGCFLPLYVHTDGWLIRLCMLSIYIDSTLFSQQIIWLIISQIILQILYMQYQKHLCKMKKLFFWLKHNKKCYITSILCVAFVLKRANTLPTHPLQLQVNQMSGLFDVQQLVMSHVALLRCAYF